MFAKSTMTLVALVLTLDALFVFSKASVTGSRIDLGGNGWNCAHVISHRKHTFLIFVLLYK